MRNYIIARILLNIPVILLVMTLVFVATRIGSDYAEKRAAGGLTGSGTFEEAVQQIRRQIGTDKPTFFVSCDFDASPCSWHWDNQYKNFMVNVIQFDFGDSLVTRTTVWSEIERRLPASIELGAIEIFFALIISVPIGIVSAIRQDSLPDYVLRIFAILGQAVPSFYLGVLFLLAASEWLNWIPPLTGTDYKEIWEDPSANLKQMLLPGLAGGLAVGAGIMRLLRSQMLEVLRQDYVRTAWSKGLRERTVVMRHVLKNALIPVVTVVGLLMAGLFSGNIVLETLFGIPGIGPLAVVAMRQTDQPMIYGVVIVAAVGLVFVNLAVDITYALVDPRIRYG
ncbi:MAG: ABC transporter permease [Dehalococcoidia bacterium]